MKTNWPTKKLGEVCDFVFGYSFRADDFNESGDGLAVIRIGDIDKRITKKFYNKKYNNKYLVNNSEILIGLSGSIKVNKWKGKKALLNQRIVKVHNFPSGVSENFVYYQLPKVLKRLEIQISQGTVKNVLLPHLFNLKIKIPPLSIQQKIVQRLDAIRKAQQLNEKQISLTNELFQSLLHRELKPEKNWKVKRFQEISNPQYGYTASAKEEGKYRFIRITDIGENGELRNTDKKYISASRKTIEPYILKKGDLLLARTGATFGKILYFDNKEQAVFASYLIKINPKKSIVSPQYIWLFSRSKYYWRQAKLLRTGSGQPQFNANKLKRVKISLPPIKIQCQIVKKLSAVLNYKKKLLRQKELLKELFESTLDKAMKGELAKRIITI